MATSGSYWQTVQLKYSDGLILHATLDADTLSQLQNPVTRESMMNTIRQNTEMTNLSSNNSNSDCVMISTESQKGREEPISDASDVEVNQTEDSSYTSWPREAILYLIDLYKENESELEDPLTKKKDVWKKITTEMFNRGYKFTQNKIESKWRTLLKSHKDILDNKRKTGAKRKTFQFFEEINQIVSKRHDINPPVVTGTLCPLKPFSDTNSTTSSDNRSEQAELEKETSGKKPAKVRRENRRSSTDNEIIKVLIDMEEARKEERREREQRRDEREKERNDLMRQFIEVMKK